MPQPQRQTAGADPVVVDATHYTVEAEDERVRILRVRYGPKAKSAMHYHPNCVAITVTSLQCRFTFPDGRTEDHNFAPGTTMILPAGDHLPENLSDQPFEVILVELKS